MLTRAEPLPDDDAGNYATGPGADQAAMDRQLRRPMMMGGLLVLVLAAGLLLWAAFFSITGAVLAPGVVRVENNSKNLSRLEPGIVRQILVREGQKVAKGQLLIRFDDTQTKAAADIFQSVVDSANAQIARFQAEAANAASVTFPADLTARSADPRVAALLASQQTLFQSRMTLYRSQAMVLNSQAQQLETQISGMRIQAQAIDDQARLVREELDGVRELSRQGYAPNSRLLALERSAVQVKGQKGSMLSEMARARQAIGEIRLQIAQLEDRHQTEVSDGIRASQERLADAEPKLRTALQQRQQAEVRAPVAGYVFNLTQFTEGGVAGAGQTLMQIVPTHTQLVVSAEVSPRDITDVKLGMPASVTLLGYNQRKVAPVEGKVSLVSADARSNEKSGISFFLVEITVPAENLAKAGPNVRLAPGMPASVAIVTGERTILDYLLEPFTDSMRSALKER
ncbi:HlyD family type I secretion periplasmic adaptor subunit [Rhizorhabdus dicambivorans]|uniref:Membrane fusion protein (MFP) family protein n=2 Tax=Rhizorhabdus dicambivorans TaxID=1850238 RepID=A0A2A4FQ00_9SPHN|nr:HlyD family type I secretion periplasmic adaptor subunit [Rhizorhabdus dicambivorans]PCE40247.1 HlyD family type I secretion periplasmic adaptor subunit [Rhizorhabdus dicambivorans]